jgi:hypothetical protein
MHGPISSCWGTRCQSANASSKSILKIADICEVRFNNRKPSHHTVQLVLATGSSLSIQTKHYQPWKVIPDPAERRLAVLFLP